MTHILLILFLLQSSLNSLFLVRFLDLRICKILGVKVFNFRVCFGRR
ncbi:unnamed protein product [Arabidopsis halleri]